MKIILFSCIRYQRLIVWFLPAIITLFFHRKHFRYILLTCITAGFLLLGVGIFWVIVGNVFDKYANKVNA